MTSPLHITLAQINPAVGALEDNARKILDVWDAAPKQTDLIVFPELVVTGYPPEDLILKPFFVDEAERYVQKLLEQSRSRRAAIILPAPMRRDGILYNAAHLIQGGHILGTVTKHNLPNYGVFDERRLFASGPFPEPIEFMGHKLGLLICEDMWFPQPAAYLKQQGADMLIVANGSPYDLTKKDIRLQKARARVNETSLPLLYVNQVGGQDDLVFDGGSFALNEKGDVVIEAASFDEDSHHTSWEKNAGGHWLCLSDLFPRHMEQEEEIYSALVLGVRDYVIKNGFPGVLIGLSGGIDSALTAAIATDALGQEMVRCVMMPSPFTSKDSLQDAKACAQALGVHYESRPIKPAMKAFQKIISGLSGIAHENMQSRSRGLILMALSNASGHMVLSTGNKSEMAVGYATLYGDMCGGYNALKDLYKTQVYALSRWRNAHKPPAGHGPAGLVIPERILTKAPSAELRPDQTDQDSLPPYDVLDDILACLIEQDMGLEDIAARGHDRETVIRVWNMLDRAEYKRRQSPPGVKVNPLSFGRERRYPITNLFRPARG